DVAGDGQPADGAGHALGLRQPQVEDGDPGARGGEPAADRLADALAAAGHHRRLAVQPKEDVARRHGKFSRWDGSLPTNRHAWPFRLPGPSATVQVAKLATFNFDPGGNTDTLKASTLVSEQVVGEVEPSSRACLACRDGLPARPDEPAAN